MSRTILAAEGLNPLIPHVAEIILGVVVFVILVFLIKKFVVPNFEKAYAERTAAIEGGIEEAAQAQKEAKAALEQYTAQLAEARHEAAASARRRASRVLRSSPRCAPRPRPRPSASSRPRTSRSRPSARRQCSPCAARSVSWPPSSRRGSSASRSTTRRAASHRRALHRRARGLVERIGELMRGVSAASLDEVLDVVDGAAAGGAEASPWPSCSGSSARSTPPGAPPGADRSRHRGRGQGRPRRSLFGGKVGSDALAIVSTAAQGRWGASRDLTDGLETAGVRRC